MRYLTAIILLFFGLNFVSALEPQNELAYGTSTHMLRPYELGTLSEACSLIKESGTSWVRTDFCWGEMEHPKGTWHFEIQDRLVREADKKGLSLLAILDYHALWARPAHQHLDHWCDYVRKVVTRYKDKIQYWEIWNEQNLKLYWSEEPNGSDYTKLLKATWETIKAIDPDLKVVYGGLAGVPHDYFEECLKAGAGPYFDVLAVHPYRSGMNTIKRTEKLYTDLDQFNLLMDCYQVPRRPIWITEMGWTSPLEKNYYLRQITGAALKILFPNNTKQKVTIFLDPLYQPSGYIGQAAMTSFVPQGTEIDFIGLKDLKKLDPKKIPFLMMPPQEACPSPYFDDLVRYVKEGGVLYFTKGIPLYHETEFKDGKLVQTKEAGNKYQRPLRISWSAGWTGKNIPSRAPVSVVPEMKDLIVPLSEEVLATRYFNDKFLKKGDRFIPLLAAKKGEFSSFGALIYKFNSDYQGAIVIAATNEVDSILQEQVQAINFPQAELISFAAGIENFFVYVFRNNPRSESKGDPAYGIVSKDLVPKPGYFAVKTLIEMRPAGSKQLPGWKQNGFCAVSWIRPDGKKGWALWSPEGNKKIKIAVSGSIVQARDYIGQPVSVSEKTTSFDLSDRVLYIIGPEKILFEN